MRSTVGAVAPIAMRMPISRVRRVAEYATRPYSPTIDSPNPIRPIAPTIVTRTLKTLIARIR